ESNRVKVLYLLGDAGLNVMGKGSFQGSVVDAIADNVAVIEKVGGSGLGNETSFEQIALWDPDMIIFAPDSIYDKVGDDATWKTLTAISNGNYYSVPGEPYNWISSPPGVNQILGYQWFARLCYPDSFSDSIADIVKDYYKTFYNYDLSDSEVADLIANSAPKK
nr:ABC transporter substrate-binding protein [bacterium]